MARPRFDILTVGLDLDDDPWHNEPVGEPLVRDAVFHDETRVRREVAGPDIRSVRA
jgi:hypothetical protein